MPVEEKKIRNKKIYRIWKNGKEGKVKNRKGYKKLAKEFGLHHTTIAKIIYRYEALAEKVG